MMERKKICAENWAVCAELVRKRVPLGEWHRKNGICELILREKYLYKYEE